MRAPEQRRDGVPNAQMERRGTKQGIRTTGYPVGAGRGTTRASQEFWSARKAPRDSNICVATTLPLLPLNDPRRLYACTAKLRTPRPPRPRSSRPRRHGQCARYRAQGACPRSVSPCSINPVRRSLRSAFQCHCGKPFGLFNIHLEETWIFRSFQSRSKPRTDCGHPEAH